ncbi:hypothetical protein Cni_G03336 [Canna indica]|uniref:Uncharacterized protein n=1 Tax=Canna indica TaxID=4628 RepID=A0AAQ3JTQ3_9LILI|nr:hypothetical protein Cni_G03336 [Canna indica]
MLTSNTLAIVDQMSTVLTSFELPSLSRRLLAKNEVSDHREFPEWFHHEKQRLLVLPPQEMKSDATVAKDGSGVCVLDKFGVLYHDPFTLGLRVLQQPSLPIHVASVMDRHRRVRGHLRRRQDGLVPASAKREA